MRLITYSLSFWACVAGLINLGVCVSFLVIRYGHSDFPDSEKIENPVLPVSSEIYTADGLKIGEYYREYRKPIKPEAIPEKLFQAIVSIEDERYMNHHGIDYRALGRAVFYMGEKGGGSTLSQQLAKLLFTQNKSSEFLGRSLQKIREICLARVLEEKYTKKEILCLYLNQFDFLYQSDGIYSAAGIYFGKKPSELNYQEAATLAGMLKNPSLYNPKSHPENCLNRRNLVLEKMKKLGYLSAVAADSLKKTKLELHFERVDHKKGPAPYFREILREKLTQLLSQKNDSGEYLIHKSNGDAYDLYTDGLKIEVTLDNRYQRHAEWALKKHLSTELQDDFFMDLENNPVAPFSWELTKDQRESIMLSAMRRSDYYRLLRTKGLTDEEIQEEFKKPKKLTLFTWNGSVDTVLSPMDSIRYHKSILRAGFMAMDPRTGAIKAWVGGPDYNFFKYDHVYQSKRQVGSAFKPFVYGYAIQNSFHPCDLIPNVPTCFEMERDSGLEFWCPQNADRVYGCEVSLKYALANSLNGVTAYLVKELGYGSVIKFAENCGIQSDLPKMPSIALGVAEISLYELVGSYGAFANEGVWNQPHFIKSIRDAHGNVLYHASPDSRTVMDKKSADDLIEMLQGVVNGVGSECMYEKTDLYRTGTAQRIRGRRPYGRLYCDLAGKTGTTQNNSDGWFIGITPKLIAGAWVGGEDRSVHFKRTKQGMGANTALPIFGYFLNRVHRDKNIHITPHDYFFRTKEDRKRLDCQEIEAEKKDSDVKDPFELF